MLLVLYIIVGLVFIVTILGFIAPKSYEVSRNIVINKSLPETFNYLKSLKNQDNWSPWGERDPNMEKEFKGTDGEVGFISAWKGNKEVGEGEQEIIGLVENELIETQLRFLKPFKSTSNAYIKVDDEQGATKVTWGFTGKNKFPVSIMMLFMNMEKAIGKDFEQGLTKLKSLLEK